MTCSHREKWVFLELEQPFFITQSLLNRTDSGKQHFHFSAGTSWGKCCISSFHLWTLLGIFHEAKKPWKDSISSGSSYFEFYWDNIVPLTVYSQRQKNKPCCVQCFPSQPTLWFYPWGRAQHLQDMDPSACWHGVGFEPWPPKTSISLSLISGSPRWGPEWVNISLLQQLPFICLYFRRGNLLTENFLSVSHSSQKQPVIWRSWVLCSEFGAPWRDENFKGQLCTLWNSGWVFSVFRPGTTQVRSWQSC